MSSGKTVEEIGRQMMTAVREFVARAIEPVAAALAELQRRLEGMPAPVHGKDGKDGERGRDGVDGKNGEPGKDADAELVRSVVSEILPGMVAAAQTSLLASLRETVAALPVPADGAPGDRGEPGKPGIDGRDGRDGIDGISGRDGKDALNVDEFAAELAEDGRTVTFLMKSGGKEFRSAVVLAVPVYKGVWRDGEYSMADVVTWNGSAWHCQRTTTEKPSFTCIDWKMMVKEGRHGKEAKIDGQPAPREPVRLR